MNAQGLIDEGLAQLRAGRAREAEAALRGAIALDARSAVALNALGLALQEQGRGDEAQRFYLDALAVRPELVEARYNLGRNHCDRGEIEAALECFEQVLRARPGDADTHAAIAIALERRDELDEAEEYFAEAARLSPHYALARLIRFGEPFLRELESACDGAPAPALAYRSEPRMRPRLTAVVACDRGYFGKYGPAFLRSFAQNAGSDCHLHLHLVDPEPGFAEAARGLLGGLAGGASVSVEDASHLGEGTRAQAVWYTCARFVHLPAWLEAWARPLVVLDVDAVVEAPLADLVGAAAGADLGLHLREPRRAPWLDVRAACVVAMPTARALRYCALVRAYVLRCAAGEGLLWHLDQIALYCTLRLLGRHAAPPAVAWIGAASERAVWQLGHADERKLSEPRYTRYLDEAGNFNMKEDRK